MKKYSDDVYMAMKEPYEEYCNTEEEFVEMVDSTEPYELFKDLCEWYGYQPSKVEFLYETFYGKGENKGDGGWFCL